MIIVDIININTNQYQNLINHILKSCDEIAFQFPGVCPDGRPLPDCKWQEYHKKSQVFLEKCFQHNAKQTCSRNYYGMRLGDFGKGIHVRFFPFLEQMLLKYHLFDWLMQNGLPEDVCFLKQKQCYVFTCSHEEEFVIYNETETDVSFLKNNDFDFWVKK